MVTGALLGRLVGRGIGPMNPVRDKSKRDDDRFSCDPVAVIYQRHRTGFAAPCCPAIELYREKYPSEKLRPFFTIDS